MAKREKEEQYLCACTASKEEPRCHKAAAVPVTPSQVDNDVNEGYSKNAKYYYTNDEQDMMGTLKKLFKTKKKWAKKCGCCKPNPSKIPPTDCRIRVEAWHKHDRIRCEEDDKDYTYLGEIIFPFCSKTYFGDEPGVPVRPSKKSFCINNEKKFGDTALENRKYAYPGSVLSSTCVC